jgi:formate hydrogenlyase subunit 4
MGRLGVFICMLAFLGVPAFVTLGLSRSIKLSILVHVTLVLLVVFGICVCKRSLHKAWLTLKPVTALHYHPVVILIIGLCFLAMGLWMAIAIEPGNEPNSMTKSDQIYFGALFAGMGAGVSLIAIEAWQNRVRPRNRNPFVSGDP